MYPPPALGEQYNIPQYNITEGKTNSNGTDNKTDNRKRKTDNRTQEKTNNFVTQYSRGAFMGYVK